jgi:hypothetical protein
MKTLIKKLLRESLIREDDIDYDGYEIMQDMEVEVMSEYLNAIEKEKPTEDKPLVSRQNWETIPFSTLERQWSEYMKYGFVKPNYEPVIEQIEKVFTENTFKIRANTVLAGHSQEDPKNNWKDYLQGTNYDNDELDNYVEYLDYHFGDFITENHGQLRISDYGLPKLERLIFELRKVHDASKKLPILDKMLNVVHQRSDIAAWFIEGGTDSLNKLSDVE